ncbi:MAG: glycosyltransferase [Polaromonas sp.]
MSDRVIFYAPNVHAGGGLVLLNALLKNWPSNIKLAAFLDARAREKIFIPEGSLVRWVYPKILSRLSAEFALTKFIVSGDDIFCFHGLPPLLPCNSRVFVFLQNRLLIEPIKWSRYKLRTSVRLAVEKLFLRLGHNKITSFIVQTPSMCRVLREWQVTFASATEVRVLPFVDMQVDDAVSNDVSSQWDFVYVADGEAHKNHRRLLAAWQLLAQDGLHPSLAFTLSSRDAALKRELEALAVEAGLQIKDLGQMPHENILVLYANAKAMIFPSTSESFGLPLIEATHLGLPILASELDYVRDVCSPVHTFDPTSPVSIARAVKRFLGVSEPALRLRSPQEFWQELLLDSRT